MSFHASGDLEKRRPSLRMPTSSAQYTQAIEASDSREAAGENSEQCRNSELSLLLEEYRKS